MKFFNYKVIAVFFVLALSGCASGPSFQDYAGDIEAASSDEGRIYMYRPSILGAALQPKVHLNNDIVGNAVSQGFFYVDRPAGDYTVSTSTEAKRSLSFHLEAGEEKYIRFEAKIGFLVGHIKPVLVDAEVGEKQIKKTKYIGK